ncbi:MAG: hypothetical protein MJZ30_05920 [Paludibacteraceae bacterium]|nr:hypothetical protein [Paludibacteraceae bacterium]
MKQNKIPKELKKEMQEEVSRFSSINDFDEGSYLIGIKHGSKIAGEYFTNYDTIPPDIIVTISNAAVMAINMAKESGLTNEEITDTLTADDIRHIIKKHIIECANSESTE